MVSMRSRVSHIATSLLIGGRTWSTAMTMMMPTAMMWRDDETTTTRTTTTSAAFNIGNIATRNASIRLELVSFAKARTLSSYWEKHYQYDADLCRKAKLPRTLHPKP